MRMHVHTLRLALCSILILSAPFVSRGASREPVRAKNGMVVSAERHASEAGIRILNEGGNAVDAAVAVGFALAVTYPQAGNIGGGGFMVIRMSDGRTTTLDYREKAPLAANRDMYLDSTGAVLQDLSLVGHRSVGVPGSVAGLLLALERFGTLPRSAVIRPAIELAEQGFPVSYRLAESLKADSSLLGQFAESKRIFLAGGAFLAEGDLLVQSDLARTLRSIAESGEDGFYGGWVADRIAEEMERGGGLITREDLRAYRALERPAVSGTYRGYEILSMGPPSAGGIALIQLLNLLEPFDLSASGFNSSRTIALMAEAMKLVYADRAEFLGDPDFTDVPVAELLSKAYADRRRMLIDTTRATESRNVRHGEIRRGESPQTTHYSVIDRWGNAVSVTTTLNGSFGSGVTVPGAGFLLNNEMDDFSIKVGVPNMYGLTGGDANAIQPGKRMLSSMTPTIILREGQPFIIVGTPGGSTIMTTVLQVILNVIDHGMNMQEAVDAPRMHHQWLPDTLYVERRGIPADVRENLERRGYVVVERRGTQGRVEGIMIDRAKGVYYGATDPRGDGAAVGY